MDKTDMDLFSFCAQQGYVPYDCQLKGILILGLIQDGKNPCVGCRANCPHHITVPDPEYVQYKEKEAAIKAEKNMRIAARMRKHNITTMMNIDCDYKNILITVICLDTERMYIKKLSSIEEASVIIPSICHAYHVEQILIETNGFGISLYDRIKEIPNVDVVPLTCVSLKI